MAENSKIPKSAVALILAAAALLPGGTARAYDFSSFTVDGRFLVFYLGALFFTLLFIPFIPGLLELYRPRDDKPLPINWSLVHDPLYFYKSFRTMLYNRLPELKDASGPTYITLSKREKIEVYTNLSAEEKAFYPDIVFIKKILRTGNKAAFRKEAFAGLDAVIGEENALRALIAERDIFLGKGTVVKRWAGAGRNITAEEGSDLGISAACRGILTISKGCRFKTLYACEINTVLPGDLPPEAAAQRVDVKKYKKAPGRKMQSIVMAKGMRIPVDVLARGRLRLGEGSVSEKSIKAHSDILVGDNCVIEGGLFSEGDIIIGRNCRIGGNVFSQGEVIIGPGAVVGRSGAVKSVIGKKALLLSLNVKIYGLARTEGRGGVLL